MSHTEGGSSSEAGLVGGVPSSRPDVLAQDG